MNFSEADRKYFIDRLMFYDQKIFSSLGDEQNEIYYKEKGQKFIENYLNKKGKKNLRIEEIEYFQSGFIDYLKTLCEE